MNTMKWWEQWVENYHLWTLRMWKIVALNSKIENKMDVKAKTMALNA